MKIWPVRLICCGLDDGYQRCPSWEEADEFRTSYVANAGGHDRAAIIFAEQDSDSLGWTTKL